ncbi:MAG: alpha/beta fold hydrolase [Planctomycetaceae bacterium]
MPTIQINGMTFNAYDAGQGAPILFVHGFPLDHTMWQQQLEHFSKTHRVIAPDLRGFGQSDVTAGTVEMHKFADDLAAVLTALDVDEPVCYCGLSMGGYIGWEFLRRHGERVGSLILCDTKAAADTPQAIEGRMKLAQAVIEGGSEAAVEAMMPKLLAESTLQRQPHLVEHIRRMIVNTDPESIAAALRGMANRRDSTDMLDKIAVPTLLIVGQHDALTPPDEMRKVAERIRDARFVEVPEAGHMSPMENGAAVNNAIDGFLTKNG